MWPQHQTCLSISTTVEKQMLKLEKSRKTGEIYVRIRTQERFFNRTFCQALGLALVLHLLGIAIFHIRPFMVDSQFIFSPIQVQTELNTHQEEPDTYILAFVEENRLLTIPSIAFPRTKPVLPEIPKQIFTQEFGVYEDESLTSLATIYEWEQPTIPLKLQHIPIMLTYYPVHLQIVEDLADIPLVRSDLPPQKTHLSSDGPLKETRTIYQVRVEGKTGEIVWAQKLESAEEPRLDLWAEKILKSLLFSPMPSLTEITGKIEIGFTMP